MGVINKSSIEKAMEAMKLSKKSVIGSREGPGWVVMVTVAGEKFLYRAKDAHPPKADYRKVIIGRK